MEKNHLSFHLQFILIWNVYLKKKSCQNNPKKSYTDKNAIHELSGWAMFTSFSFDEKENELNYYRGKDCIEKLCEMLKTRAMKIINYEKRK